MLLFGVEGLLHSAPERTPRMTAKLFSKTHKEGSG
jgi:hypothetical protein